MEDEISGDRNQETLAKHRSFNGNGIGSYDRPESGAKGGDGDKMEEDEGEECDVEVWGSLSESFNQVQSVLDQNKVLIQQVNENHQSKIPENFAKNVALISQINRNIVKEKGLLTSDEVLFTDPTSGYNAFLLAPPRTYSA